jgi:peptide/nickel transport system substrate-binding protein
VKKSFRLAGAILAAALVSTALAACGGKGSSSDSSTLNVGLPAIALPTDFNAAKGVSAQYFFDLAYAPLIHLNDDGTFGPGLAKSFGYVGTGNTKFDLTLRQDAKFSDGSPVNAAAVKSWLEYYAKNGAFASQFKIKSIDTPTDYEVEITFNQPTPGVKWNLAESNGWGFIANPKAVADPAQLSTATYGAGPYVYDSSQSQPGSQYTFVPNKYFYDKSTVHFQKIVLKQTGSASSMLQALKAGQINAGLGDFTVQHAATNDGFTSEAGLLSWVGLTMLNKPGKPWNSLAVRQAVNYALDRNTLTQAMTGGLGSPTSEWLTTDGYDQAYANHYSYDPAKAKQLLQVAGYSTGVTLNIASQSAALGDGTPAGNLVQAIATQLQKVGITLNITTVAPGKVLNAYLSGKYDGVLSNFGANSFSTYIPIFIASPLAGNGNDPTLKNYIAQYLVANDPSTIAQAASRYVTDQGLVVPIYTAKTFMFTRGGLQGVTFPTLPNGIAYGVHPNPTEWHF